MASAPPAAVVAESPVEAASATAEAPLLLVIPHAPAPAPAADVAVQVPIATQAPVVIAAPQDATVPTVPPPTNGAPADAAAAPFDVTLLEDGEAFARLLPHRFEERQVNAAPRTAAHLKLLAVLTPLGDVGHEIDPERPSFLEDPPRRLDRQAQVALG